MLRYTGSILLAMFFIGCAPSHRSAPAPEQLRVLVLTGEDNAHDSEANSSRIIENWANWGITDVDRQFMPTEQSWREWGGSYSDYDAVVFMYYTANAPADPVQELADYVAEGGALVVVHSALAGLTGHEAYDELIGVGWRDANYGSSISFNDAGERRVRPAGDGRGAAHPPLGDFEVQTLDTTHPITRGLPSPWLQPDDELYFNLRGPVGNIHVIATARPRGSESAPVLWTNTHGEGRVFVTALGHHQPSIDSPGFMTTLTRGLEWAVTGRVTSRVPASFAASESPVAGGTAFR